MSVPQMSSQSGKPQPAVTGSDAAPIIYCDGIVAAGTLGGIVQLELAANLLIPTELENNRPPKRRVLVTGHIRCSAQAALAIRDSIDKLLRIPAPAVEPLVKTVPAKAKPKAQPQANSKPRMPEIERQEMTRSPTPSEMVDGE
jgi:hypothetical protein